MGGFTAENLTKENQKEPVEFLINSHGQRNNIDKCWYVNGKENRESLINVDTINTVLSSNPYYLDCWTCNNGYEMKDNLVTEALTGKCIGYFAATHIISNNGVDCRASLDEMKRSNFYYFYYTYLESLYNGRTRACAFADAQKAYAKALMEDSKKELRYASNYQFNLYNLIAYENFGVMEPRTVVNSEKKAAGVSSDKDSTASAVNRKDDNGDQYTVAFTVSGKTSGKTISAKISTETLLKNAKNMKENDYFLINIAAENGKIKSKLVLRRSDVEKGKYLYIYKKGKTVNSMTGLKTGKVGTGRSFEITVPASGTYILLKKSDASTLDQSIVNNTKLKRSTISLKRGKKALVSFSKKADTDSIKKITYATAKKKIATISSKGKITAKKKGTTKITVKVNFYNGQKKTLKLKVKVAG